jgi:hypothetical protein
MISFQMTLWGQYGDDLEQDSVIAGVNAYSDRIGTKALDLDY